MFNELIDGYGLGGTPYYWLTAKMFLKCIISTLIVALLAHILRVRAGPQSGPKYEVVLILQERTEAQLARNSHLVKNFLGEVECNPKLVENVKG